MTMMNMFDAKTMRVIMMREFLMRMMRLSEMMRLNEMMRLSEMMRLNEMRSMMRICDQNSSSGKF
jgi:hypothetical protein